MDDGTGDGDTLFLTAGEFSGTVVEAVGEADEVEGGLGADAAFGAGEFGEEEGEFDVFEGAEDGDEVVELEDVADADKAAADAPAAPDATEDAAKPAAEAIKKETGDGE